MEYTLENGMRIVIRGSRFIVDVDHKAGITYIEPVFSGDQTKNRSLDQLFNDFNSPAISPEPSPVVSYSDIQEKARIENETHYQKSIKDTGEGMEKFKEFIEAWSEGFGVKDADQPDRAKILNDTMSFYSGSIFKFIKNCGGLTHAIFGVLDDSDIMDMDDRMHNRLLAENIAQVSSILYPPLAETLEYPFKI